MSANKSNEGLGEEVARRSSVENKQDEKEEEAKEFYQHLIQHSQIQAWRMFIAGSRSEITGQEIMLHHCGLSTHLVDADFMYCNTYIYVTTHRETVPDQFNGRVVRTYSRGLHAGYVKLFDEDIQIELTRKDVKSRHMLDKPQGPADTLLLSNERENNKTLKHFISQEDWVANCTRTDVAPVVDHVSAVHSRYWPLEMNEWITRQRLSGFPSKSVIKEVIQYECDFVQVCHRLSTNINEWRFSFSKAEFMIIHSWTSSQRCVYRTLQALNKMIKNNTDSNHKLCTYYFKTLMLWATEKRPAEFWYDNVLANSVYELLYELMHWLEQKFCPNYFIPTNNMIDHLTGIELSEGIHALSQLLQNRQLIVDVFKKSRFIEAGVNEKYYLKMPVWLYTGLLIAEQLHESEDRFTKLFTESSSALIDEAMSMELSPIYHGQYYYIMAENSLIQSDNYYLLKSIEHFHCYGDSHSLRATVVVFCSRNIALSLIGQWFENYKPEPSESHSLLVTPNAFPSADSWNVLSVSNDQVDEKCLLYSQSMYNADKPTDVHFNENIYCYNTTTVTVYLTAIVDKTTYIDALFYKQWPGISPTVNISWFINKAYLANIYYLTLRDYRATENICDNIIHVSKESYYNQRFAESELPMILSTEWTTVYDEGLQAMLGFYSLCSFMFNKADHSRSVCIGVCPVLFAWYLKIHCIADQMDIDRWNKWANVKHFDAVYFHGDKSQNGLTAMQASFIVIEQTFKRLLTLSSTSICR